MVRRLPVLQNTEPAEERAEQRPRSHWVVIAAGLTLSIWVPLSMLGLALGRVVSMRLMGTDDPHALSEAASRASAAVRALAVAALLSPALLSLAVAAWVAGALVGRFGGRAGQREAVVGGGMGALVAWVLAMLGGALGSWPVALGTALVLVSAGSLAGGLGGRFGRKRRPRL